MRVEIPSRVAPAEAGQDLVADGAGLGCDAIDGVVRPDEIDRHARPHGAFGQPADIEHGEVHGDAANNREAPPIEIGAAAVREGAHETVRVADTDRRQPRRPGETMGRTIANGTTSVNAPDLQDFRLQSNDLTHRVWLSGERLDAVERRAWAHEVEGVLCSEEDARRCRETPGDAV